MRRVVKHAAVQLVPVLVGEAIPITECGADVRWITWVRGFLLLFFLQDGPIYDRTIGNHFCYALIHRGKNGGSTTKTSADDENLIGRANKLLTKGKFSNSFGQLAHDVENIFVRRAFKKLPSTLPCSAPSRIKDPISF